MNVLPAAHQAAVLETINKLQRGAGSTHLHALGGLKWVSFCVSKDAVRVICDREGSTLVLAWAGFHDDAYRWAERHKPERFGLVLRFVRVPVDEDEAPRDASQVAPPGPLVGVRDKSFRALEVGPGLATVLREVPDEDTLLELCTHLEKPLAEALIAMAADPEAFPAIVARFQEAKAGAAASLAEAVKASVNSESIWVVPPEQESLRAALAGDAEVWRVFLHPSQRRLVEMKTSGPYLVTGGPGTGKTVVALHRARYLADSRGDPKTPLGDDGRPVLLTTFSRVLARQLEEGFAAVCRDAPELVERVVTATLTGAARAVLDAAKAPSTVLFPDDVDACWDEALARDAAGRGRRFYESERETIVFPAGVETEEVYLRTPRPGRGERLDRAAKKAVWAVLEAYEAALVRRGGDDPAGLARRATRLLRDGAVPSPFAAVICDEVQDASTWELQLLAALAREPGTAAPGPDRLFLVGDGHQRLYQRPSSLRACGIEVRGRSARLRLNYRTTQGICAAALAALEGIALDVLEEESGEGTGDYRSVRAGKRPEVLVFPTPEAEADFIAEAIRESVKDRPFLVLARTRAMLSALKERLRARGLTVPILGEQELLPAGEAVALATLHRSKGLEAPRVILAGMQESPARFPGGDEAERALWARREKLLLYVGMTRARDWCALTRVAEAHA